MLLATKGSFISSILQYLIVQHFINLGHEKSDEKQGIPFNIRFPINPLLFWWIATGPVDLFFSPSTWQEHVASHNTFTQPTLNLKHGNVLNVILLL